MLFCCSFFVEDANSIDSIIIIEYLKGIGIIESKQAEIYKSSLEWRSFRI